MKATDILSTAFIFRFINYLVQLPQPLDPPLELLNNSRKILPFCKLCGSIQLNNTQRKIIVKAYPKVYELTMSSSRIEIRVKTLSVWNIEYEQAKISSTPQLGKAIFMRKMSKHNSIPEKRGGVGANDSFKYPFLSLKDPSSNVKAASLYLQDGEEKSGKWQHSSL